MATAFAARARLHHGFAGAPPARGRFVSRATVDDSPEGLELTRLAVACVKDGDQEAFRYLYLRYAGNIYGYVRSIVHDDYEAEDVTQQVFAKLLVAIAKYDDRGVPFFAWLLRLARNAAIDHLRSVRVTPQADPLDAQRSFEDSADGRWALRDALRRLPADQREVVLLRHVVGLSPGEIADRMRRSEGSIHGLHHRGRRTLQHELATLASAPSTATRRAA